MQTILLVEEYFDLQEAISLFLNHKGYHVVKAVTLSQAEQVFQTTNIDIVLCDMETLTSTAQLLTEARREHFIPAIAFSNWCTKEDQQHALAQGFQAFFPKPFDLREVAGVISTLLLTKDPTI